MSPFLAYCPARGGRPPLNLAFQAKSAASMPAFTVVWLAIISAAGIQSVCAATLQVTVTGIHNNKGEVYVCVFDSEQGFPDCSKVPVVMSVRHAALIGSMHFDVDVSPGIHAVSVLHDENDNGKLDTNFLGIPTEGVGVSNNPAPRLGPPRFSEAAFRLLPQGGQIEVKLVYP